MTGSMLNDKSVIHMDTVSWTLIGCLSAAARLCDGTLTARPFASYPTIRISSGCQESLMVDSPWPRIESVSRAATAPSPAGLASSWLSGSRARSLPIRSPWYDSLMTLLYEGVMLTQRQNGGLLCKSNGNAEKPFKDQPYCVDGVGTVAAVNECGKALSFCQTGEFPCSPFALFL